jgi:exodeoxyribonuclease III
MRIATFNINSINGRLANLLRWLEVSSPDVACLQEIKCTNAAFPRKALEAAGYSAIWCGQGPHHGVAILARDVDPIETRRNLPGNSADREARYIEAAVNGVLIGCLYLPNGNPQPGPNRLVNDEDRSPPARTTVASQAHDPSLHPFTTIAPIIDRL